MASGEQVLPCPTCQQPTTHRPTPPDGWLRCYLCAPDVPVAPAKPPEASVRIPVRTLLLVGILIVIAGFTHVVHGGAVGLTVCAKDGWSLSDTFVDLDDYIGKPLISQLDKAKVLRAMFACEVLQRPNFGDH